MRVRLTCLLMLLIECAALFWVAKLGAYAFIALGVTLLAYILPAEFVLKPWKARFFIAGLTLLCLVLQTFGLGPDRFIMMPGLSPILFFFDVVLFSQIALLLVRFAGGVSGPFYSAGCSCADWRRPQPRIERAAFPVWTVFGSLCRGGP